MITSKKNPEDVPEFGKEVLRKMILSKGSAADTKKIYRVWQEGDPKIKPMLKAGGIE